MDTNPPKEQYDNEPFNPNRRPKSAETPRGSRGSNERDKNGKESPAKTG